MGIGVAGVGDVTGDRVPDLAVRYATWAVGDNTDPVVEVISGALLARICPEHRCVAGRTPMLWSDGDYRRVVLQDVGAPDRFVLHSPLDNDPRFGVAIAGVDLDGDGASELLVGAADTGFQSALAGAVLGWRGGAAGADLTGDPWLVAVGDLRASTRFGSAIAAMPERTPAGAWLVVGAPGASDLGPSTGAAFRWFIPR